MSRQLAILLITCFILSVRASTQVYPFVSYTPRDGLVGNRVRFISQDSKGKLYFGTTNGLSVYDGSRFTNYSTENGLYHNFVNGIEEAGNDSVLGFSAVAGLCRKRVAVVGLGPCAVRYPQSSSPRVSHFSHAMSRAWNY